MIPLFISFFVLALQSSIIIDYGSINMLSISLQLIVMIIFSKIILKNNRMSTTNQEIDFKNRIIPFKYIFSLSFVLVFLSLKRIIFGSVQFINMDYNLLFPLFCAPMIEEYYFREAFFINRIPTKNMIILNIVMFIAYHGFSYNLFEVLTFMSLGVFTRIVIIPVYLHSGINEAIRVHIFYNISIVIVGNTMNSIKPLPWLLFIILIFTLVFLDRIILQKSAGLQSLAFNYIVLKERKI